MFGSGIATNQMMKKAAMNTAIPMKRRGATSLMLVFAVTVPTSTPANSGVRVPLKEFNVPPI